MKKERFLLKSFFWFGLVFFLCQNAWCDDAIKVFLELSSSTATVFPGAQSRDYLRGRAVFLDSDNELATTFNGSPLSAAKLFVQSDYRSQVRFSDRSAVRYPLSESDWQEGATSVEFSIEKAWKEFAINYDGVDKPGEDTLTVTLTLGEASVAAQTQVTVKAPPANTYVVRTGGRFSTGDGQPTLKILEKIPGRTSDGGSVKNLGDSTTVEVFAAFYNKDDGNVYYTDNLPSGGETVDISGGDGATLTLKNGFARTSIVVDSGVKAQETPSGAADNFANGKQVIFSALPTNKMSRWIGNGAGDANAEENVYADKGAADFSAGGSLATDNASYKPDGPLSRITIIGLPVNEVTSSGEHKESGINAQQQEPGTLEISLQDAYDLLGKEGSTLKPSPAFRVPGIKNTTCIYGAVVGFDADNNPAPFVGGQKVKIYLKKKNGVAVNTGIEELAALRPFYDDATSAYGSFIQTAYANQAFLPFRITATAVDGDNASIENLYIDKIVTVSGAQLDPKFYSNVDEESEGVDFIAQNSVGAITLTGLRALRGGVKAGEDAEVEIKGRGEDKTFEMHVVGIDGDTVKIGLKNTGEVLDSVQIPKDKDGVSRKEVAFFSALGGSVFCVFKSLEQGTTVLQFYPPADADEEDGLGVIAADPDDFPPATLTAKLKEVNVLLDEAERHDTLALLEVIDVKDAFSNAYSATGALLEDAKLSAEIFLSDGDGEALDMVFPGATVGTDDNLLKMSFDLEQISAGQDAAVVKLSSPSGHLTTEFNVNVRAAKQVGLKNIFVPVPGITDTPVEVFLADQNGSPIAPVTITADTAVDNDLIAGRDAGKGNVLEFEVDSDDGQLANTGTGGTLRISTVAPRNVFTVQPGDNRTELTITGKASRYPDGVLLLSFEPDFNPPYVGEITTQGAPECECFAEIEVVDDTDIDLGFTTLTITDNSSNDITDTLTRSDLDEGAGGTILLEGFPDTDCAEAEYSLSITARDAWQNVRTVQRSFTVECDQIEPACISVGPEFGVSGDEALPLSVSTFGTEFTNADTTVSLSCTDNATVIDNSTAVSDSGINSQAVTVNVRIAGTAGPNSPTNATAVSFAMRSVSAQSTPDDDPGEEDEETDTQNGDISSVTCDVTVSDGSGTSVTCEDAFTIYSEQPAARCLDVSPSAVQSGDLEEIVISANAFADLSGLTRDDVNISCENSSVEVNDLKSDSSSQQVTVEINSAPSMATDTCSVSIVANGETLSCAELTVSPFTEQCRLIRISRQVGRAGKRLPRWYPVTITGNGLCAFGSSPEVSFGTPDITAKVLPLLSTARQVVCMVKVSPGTLPLTYNVSVNGITGVTFTVR